MTNNILKYIAIFLCVTIFCSFVMSSYASADTDGILDGYDFPDIVQFDYLYGSIMEFNNNPIPIDFDINYLKANYPFVTIFYKHIWNWGWQVPAYYLLFSNRPVHLTQGKVFFDDFNIDYELKYKLYRIDSYSRQLFQLDTSYDYDGLYGSYGTVREFPIRTDFSNSEFKVWSNRLYYMGDYYSNIAGYSSFPEELDYTLELLPNFIGRDGLTHTTIKLSVWNYYPAVSMWVNINGSSYELRAISSSQVGEPKIYYYYLDDILNSFTLNENVTIEYAEGIGSLDNSPLTYQFLEVFDYSYRFVKGDTEYFPSNPIQNIEYNYYEWLNLNKEFQRHFAGGIQTLTTYPINFDTPPLYQWTFGSDFNKILYGNDLREDITIIFVPDSLDVNEDIVNSYDVVVYDVDDTSMKRIYPDFNTDNKSTWLDNLVKFLGLPIVGVANAPNGVLGEYSENVGVIFTPSYFTKKVYYLLGYTRSDIVDFEIKWVQSDKVVKMALENFGTFLYDIAVDINSISAKLDNIPKFFETIIYKLDSFSVDIPILYDDIYIPKIIIIFKDLYDSIKETLLISFDDVYRLCTFDYVDSSGNLSLPLDITIPTPPLLEGGN